MKVLIAGATGFIGKAVVARLAATGHEPVAWVRNTVSAAQSLGEQIPLVEVEPPESGSPRLIEALASCDAVINFTGEPLVGKRWTDERRRVLVSSRVDVTRQLVAAMVEAKRPKILVSGSAVGIYGNRGNETLTEESSTANDFMATLCKDWEAAAVLAAASGVRVVCVRTGIVLGTTGGALAQMLPPFRVGVGGRIGDGRQYLPWIHIDDMVTVIVSALVDDRYHGPVHGTAPSPVPQREFAKRLGRALHRPAVMPLPTFALKLIFGDAAQVLLASLRAVPSRLTEAGFSFSFPTLESALENLVTPRSA